MPKKYEERYLEKKVINSNLILVQDIEDNFK